MGWNCIAQINHKWLKNGMIPANAQNPDSKIVLKCVNYTVIKKMIISLPPKNLGFKGMRIYLIQKLELDYHLKIHKNSVSSYVITVW